MYLIYKFYIKLKIYTAILIQALINNLICDKLFIIIWNYISYYNLKFTIKSALCHKVTEWKKLYIFLV